MTNVVTLENHSAGICILNMVDVLEKNTFTEIFVTQMVEKLQEVSADKDCKVVILKGMTNIFSAGAAKEMLLELTKGEAQVKDFVLSELIVNMPVPVIAAMEGGAVGGGFVIGLCSDIIVMAEKSLYGGGFLSLGFTPGMGYTRLLQGLVGEYVANELMFTGDLYKGKVFKEKGLVNDILPKDKVMEKALSLAEVIAEKPRKTLEVLKYSLSLKKRQLLAEARVHEDFMHTITFAQKETKNIIVRMYSNVK